MLKININDLQRFRLCPLRAYFYEQEKKDEKKVDLGTLFTDSMQAAILYFYTRLLDKKICSEKLLHQKFESLYLDYIKQSALESIDRDHFRVSLREGKDALSFFQKQQLFYPDEIILLNVLYELHIPDTQIIVSDYLPLARSCSRGTEVVTFVQFKQKATSFYFDSDLKMTASEWAYEKIIGKKADRLCIQFIRMGQSFFTERNDSDRKKLIQLCKNYEMTRKLKLHYPNEGKHCDRCPYAEECKRWSGHHDQSSNALRGKN